MKFVTPSAAPKRNVLLYGPPKTGKTVAAMATSPPPVVALNADLPNATWLAHQVAPDLRELAFDAPQHPTYTLVKQLEEIANSRRTGGVETVVIDPLGELYLRLLRELSNDAISPSLPTYLAVQTHIERLCRALCECPALNAVFVAHDTPLKDESSGEVERLPSTGTSNPTLGLKLMSMVDIVGYTGVIVDDEGRKRYVAQLVNHKGRRGGDRFNSLGDLRDLNITEWLSIQPDVASIAVPRTDEAQPDQSESLGSDADHNGGAIPQEAVTQ